jgi:hypothetical protein
MNYTWKKSRNQPKISFVPRGVIDTKSKIYSLGSCFANELNNHLLKLGNYTVPSLSNDIYSLFSDESKQDTSWGAWDIRAHLQYFNVISILQEIERSLGVWEIDTPNLAKVVHPETNRTLYQDPYRRMVFSDTPADAILLAKSISKSMRQSLDNTEAIIITLGLIEAWETMDGKIACNEPSYGGGCRKPFLKFKLLTLQENLIALEKIVQLIQTNYGNKPIILTVSPIPLARSFQYDKDIYVSNMESKCLLRTAISECVKDKDNVFYFHSYEICKKDEEKVFLKDGRHVDPDFIPKILETFKEMFVK